MLGKIQPSKMRLFHAGLIAVRMFVLKDVLVFLINGNDDKELSDLGIHVTWTPFYTSRN